MATPEQNPEHVELSIDGQPYEVLALDSTEAVSELFRIAILCVSSETGPKPFDLLGKEVSILLRDGYGNSRPVEAIVAEARTRVFDEGKTLLTVVARPAAYRLTLGRDCRVFQDMSAVDIVKDILARAELPARWELGESYPVRVYTAQYRESDWTFASRLLEEEGIHYWFDHEGAESMLVFGDMSTTAADLVGGAAIAFEVESGQIAGTETVHELGSEVQLASDRFVLSSFDPERPSLAVSGSHGTGRFEVYDAPGGGPASPEVCVARARVFCERAGAERAGVNGASNSVRLVPGRVVDISGHPLSTLDGRYFISRSAISLKQRQHGSDGQEHSPPECRFGAIEVKVPFRPAHDTEPTKQAGLQSGVVVGPGGEEVHPNDKGEIRLQFHWDRIGQRDDKAGKWMRVSQRGTAESMLLPRIGWTVMTMNEEGSVDMPLALSRIFDGEHPPPYALPGNKTVTAYRTGTIPSDGTFNEVRFESKEGVEEMFINATKDMKVLVQDTKTETVRANASREVGVDHSLDVGNNSAESVVLDQTITIAGNETEDVGEGRQKSIAGSETAKVGGGRNIETGGALSTNITGSRKLAVGAAQLDVSLGDVSVAAPLVNTLVGGAMVKASAASLTENIGSAPAFGPISGPAIGGVLQAIGGAKIEISVKDRTITVKKIYNETVGGSMVLNTSAELAELADLASSVKVGGALAATAPEIIVEATAEIVVKCGGSTLTINSGGVKIKAGNINLSDAALLEATGATVEHNC